MSLRKFPSPTFLHYLFLNDSGLSVRANDARLTQEFLEWCLYGKQDEIYALGRGAAQKNLDMDQFPCLPLPLPPLSVQREVVARLDAAKAKKQKLVAAAKRGRETAALMRKAILKEAFE